jgi:hypothetical protein
VTARLFQPDRMVITWMVFIVLARHLPEGTVKELARFLPAVRWTGPEKTG